MSITNWTRLEPDTQTNVLAVDLDEGVAAKLADPLWMLGRQWQMGELAGEDAASPVVAHLEASSYALTGLRNGDAPAVAYDVIVSTPVEALVEHDGAQPDERTRAIGGISLVERLTEALLPHYADRAADHFPLRPGAPDGVTVLAVHDAGGLRANLGVTATDAPAFDAIVDAWAAWFRPRAGRVESPAWIADRLEYRFAMTAAVAEGTATLTAPEHSGGALEWFTFSSAEIAAGTPPGTPTTTIVDVTPTLLHIAGMPALTFWEVEDPSFDPGRIDVAIGDTARLLVVEAALAVAADWFLVPLRLPIASASRLDHLLITDTFGVTTEILAADTVRPHPAWNLWRIDGLPYLLLPPPGAGNLIAEPDAQVQIVRDEDANLAWALQLVPQVHARPDDPVMESTIGADLTYVPITPIDADRVPLVLVETDGIRRLVRGHLAGARLEPTGSLVGPGFTLCDEELPDEGLVIEHRFELGRTPDGALHLWSSRAKRIGARTPASGLTFDRLV